MTPDDPARKRPRPAHGRHVAPPRAGGSARAARARVFGDEVPEGSASASGAASAVGAASASAAGASTGEADGRRSERLDVRGDRRGDRDPDATQVILPRDDEPGQGSAAMTEEDHAAAAEAPDADASAWDAEAQRRPGRARGADRAAAGSTAAIAAGAGEGAAATPPGSAAEARSRGRRRADVRQGSLPRAAGWTVLTTLLPGTGLLTTRLRWLGVVLLAVIVLAIGSLAAWFLLGDPVPTLLRLAVNRTVIIGAIVAVLVVGLIWILQIALSNRAHNTKEHLRRGRRLVSALVALVMVVGVGASFAAGTQRLYAMQGLLGNEKVFGGKNDTDDRIADGSDPWKGVGRLNVMLLGQDAGADRTGTRPDTIMVASIDTETGRTALFSIPRNLQYVRFPAGTVEAQQFPEGFTAFGKNENLINAVWSWADDNKGLFPGDSNPGLTATQDAVEQTLGLKMDYYAMVDLQGFQDLVNAMGGVDMDVERRIPIGGGTNQATGGKYPITGYIEPGEQHLDGYHALWYARSREGSDDYNRMCRQQRMVRVVTEKAKPAQLAASFPKLVNATENNIQTDIPSSRLDAFVDLALRVKKGGFQSYPITQDIDTPGANNWHEYGHPDWDYLHQWVQSSIKASTKTAEADTVSTGDNTPTAASTTPADEQTTTEATQPSSAPTSATPTAVQDPLKSCLPGANASDG